MIHFTISQLYTSSKIGKTYQKYLLLQDSDINQKSLQLHVNNFFKLGS